jgi:glyoxylase-like metal-dependent hydrolase (beta-lactamase superfamily II)
MEHPIIRAFFDEPTNTVSYLVWDPATKEGAVVDPVLDWDNRSGEADTRSADTILEAARDEGVTVRWVLETHAHADHLTAAPYIKARTGALIGIGEHIKDVQRIFRPVFDAQDLKPDGGDFDRLFRDGERIALGRLEVEVMHVPGHTRRHRLSDRRRRVRRRHAVHARLRDGAGGFPRRRRARPLSLDPPPPGAAARHAPVDVP